MEKEIILYTTHCPKCKVLEKKLTNANLQYKECVSTKIMLEKNIVEVPVLEIDGTYYKFSEAVNYINQISNKKVKD